MNHKTKILITGASGLVASRLRTLFAHCYTVSAPSRDDLDILSADSIDRGLDRYAPDCVIHAAAYTNVGDAEQERDNMNGLAWRVNVDGTRMLAEVCRKSHVPLIYLSTDMVFGGHPDQPGPYSEVHQREGDSNRVSWYGWTKGNGELTVLSVPDNTVVRISHPVGVVSHRKKDYMRKLSDLMAGPLFHDQLITLTCIDELAYSLTKIIDYRLRGIFHVSSVDTFSPHELGRYAMESVGSSVIPMATTIHEVRKDSPARYPQYGGLYVAGTQERLGFSYSGWRDIVDRVITLAS